MKKTAKTSEILSVYNVLSSAKYTKLDDADKIKVWKLARKMKPIATKFDEDSKDAAEKLKPSEAFDERLSKAREYERLQTEGKPTVDIMTTADYKRFLDEIGQYNRLVGDAVKEFADKEVEMEFDALSEESFGLLMASNEWTVGQTTVVGDFVCE